MTRLISFTTGNPVSVTLDLETRKVLEVVVDVDETRCTPTPTSPPVGFQVAS